MCLLLVCLVMFAHVCPATRWICKGAYRQSLYMIAEGFTYLHLHAVDLVAQPVALKPMQVACSGHPYVAWSPLIQHLHCQVWFGPGLRVAAQVTRLGWPGLV